MSRAASKNESTKASVVTVTVCDVAENHAHMQKIGTLHEKGYSVEKLIALGETLREVGLTTEYVSLDAHWVGDGAVDPAGVLIIRKGVQHILGTEDTKDLQDEHKDLDVDKMAFMFGRVVNKRARWNLCFAEEDQEPNYEEGMGRIVAYRHLPLTQRIRQTIAKWTEDELLNAEANYYYDLSKCSIRYHGDGERRKVFAFRIGASERMPLYYQWYQRSAPVGDRIKVVLEDGDMYVMSEKAVGFDWLKKIIPTLRHASGTDQFTVIRPTNISNRHLTTKKIEPSKNELVSINKTEHTSKMKCSIYKQGGHNKCSYKTITTPVSASNIEAETDIKIKPPVKVDMTTITICTEESPQVNEIEFILQYLGVPCKVRNIPASVKGNVWDGTFRAETDNPSINVDIILVKGSGSFVDYIVYDIVNPDKKTIPILLMESTKTTDSESRNTAINQRFTKFAVAKQRFPSTPRILYYNTEQVNNTATSLFGRRLLTTFGISAYDVTGKDLLADSPPFTSVEEIIKEKNAFKEKKGNVSVKITLTAPHRYTISAKLSKGNNTTICHDPNKGLVTGIASAIYSLDKEAEFLITNHCVDVDKIKKTTEKFWYANSAYDLKLEGCNASSKGIACPTSYWTRDSKSEKASTINYQNYMEKNGWTTVYHNHSSSARSYLIDLQGNKHQVPKDLTIPDVVMLNKEKHCIQVCEGKILKDSFLGVKQLQNLTNFLKYLETHYMGYTVERGLCLYGNTFREIESIKKQLSYPVFFAMDSTGTLYY